MTPVIVATIKWDHEAKDGEEWSVDVSELGRGMLATLTDFELKVCAAEIAIHVRNALEMPPSPQTLK